MNKAQGATAAGASAENTLPETEVGSQRSEIGEQKTEVRPQPEKFGTRLGAVLANMDDLPADLLGEEVAAAEKAGELKTDVGGLTSEVGGEPEVEMIEGGEPEPELKPTAQQVEVEQEEDKQPLPDEWPESARAQVMTERAKRKKAREREQAALGKIQEKETQLQEAQAKIAQLASETPVQAAPVATEADPLADVQSPKKLEEAVKQYEELQEFCAQYPNGVEGVDVKTGEVRSDFTEEDVTAGRIRNYSAKEIARMNLTASRILQKAVPVKRQYFQERMQYDPIARRIYPEVFDQNGRLSAAARELVTYMPNILKFSDGLLIIGRYLRGMKDEQAMLAEQMKKKGQPGANGAGNGNGKPANEKIAPFLRKQPPISSSAPANRTGLAPASRRGNGDVDLEQAEQAAIESGGDEDDIENLIAATLGGTASGKRQSAPI